MTAKVFIDGEVGTTGLQIRERLAKRGDITLISLDEAKRKDAAARKEAINAADVAILCLPDEAAIEAASLVESNATKIIDASTAHRVNPNWVYGFPEYERDQAQKIATGARVSNPGCYALTAVAMIHPLVKAGLLPADWPLTINAVSGYSGGGKALIAAFEDKTLPAYTREAYRVYALGLKHKHLPEITKWGGLKHAPIFVPAVGRYHQGMIVQLPLALWALPKTPSAGDIQACLAAHYEGCRFVEVPSLQEIAAIDKLDPESLNGTNKLRLHVFSSADSDQAVVMGLIDNLGKGASGQAVQNLNLMLGLDEGTGL